MAKPAQTIPSTLELKERGVPSPTPLFSSTPQANQKALEKFSASSSGSAPLSYNEEGEEEEEREGEG